ncbi:bola protein [Collybia nuda]|uniref:Bola protein n=1 Tax=Collybia nuda TaxID=64659 RepID=A0A9P5YHT7_9AGAR|nr:bola protein [Collybia nuda]
MTDAPPVQLEGEKLIHAKLTDRFSPSQLQVQDVSGGCGSFYAITIASQSFKGLSVVKQHKLVTETLKKEIEGIHGLQVRYSRFRTAGRTHGAQIKTLVQ